MRTKNITALLMLWTAVLIFNTAAAAQETESAASSALVNVSLPANAQRIAPASVPQEISETLEKLVAAGEGKVRQGDSEVLVWAGADYKKANAPTIIYRLTDTLKAAGWRYEVGGEESGITVFSLLTEKANRRAVIGFYGATDDALVFAWTELLSNESKGARAVQNDTVEAVSARQSGGAREIVGTWTNGSTSMLGEKNLTTGVVTSRNGSTFKYVFTADGRFESIGLIQSTMYGCTTSLFNDKRGRYEISGNQITLIPSKNFWRNTYSCSPSSNKERDYVLERETLTFRTKVDEYGKTLVCLANAKGESCYRRAE
jgi:hypothetical protein